MDTGIEKWEILWHSIGIEIQQMIDTLDTRTYIYANLWYSIVAISNCNLLGYMHSTFDHALLKMFVTSWANNFLHGDRVGFAPEQI